MEVGGLLTWPAVCDDYCGLRHKSMGLGAGYGCATGSKRQRAVQWMSSPSLTEFFVPKLMWIASFTHIPTHVGRNMLGRLVIEKKKKSKPKKFDSAFESEHDQVRGCPGIVHRIKHSPQCLNALRKAAMSDTTEKKCWTHRNWSPHLWEHINPNTSISHDENYRTSGIYLFAYSRPGNFSFLRFPRKYVDCLFDLDLQRVFWLHFKAHYMLWRGTIISLRFL